MFCVSVDVYLCSPTKVVVKGKVERMGVIHLRMEMGWESCLPVLSDEGGGEISKVLGPSTAGGGVVEGAKGLEERHDLCYP